MVNNDLFVARLNVDLHDTLHDEVDVLANVSWRQDLLIELVDHALQMERDFFDNPLIKLGQVLDPLVTVHEEVGHWVPVVGLDSLGHLLSKSGEPHRDHEVVFDLEAGDGAVVLANDRG